MNLVEHVQQKFAQSIKTQMEAESLLAEPIARAASLIVQRLLEGSKILCCGNGAGAADAQRFSSDMLNRFERERPGLPALALTTDTSTLTAIASDYDYDEVFAKQLHAIGHPGDLLLVISSHDDAENLCAAVAAAHEREMFVVMLTANQPGRLADHLREHDVEIRVPTEHASTAREVHVVALNSLCDLIDLQLLGS
ncbi:MAG: SIS domain-containing protein [Chromatiales bacterium]|nr:SIS domain-containing protein [Chromatiales bacterium]